MFFAKISALADNQLVVQIQACLQKNTVTGLLYNVTKIYIPTFKRSDCLSAITWGEKNLQPPRKVRIAQIMKTKKQDKITGDDLNILIS